MLPESGARRAENASVRAHVRFYHTAVVARIEHALVRELAEATSKSGSIEQPRGHGAGTRTEIGGVHARPRVAGKRTLADKFMQTQRCGGSYHLLFSEWNTLL
jgi:hypothetical protein